MNKELIRRQLTFLGFVLGTVTIYIVNWMIIDYFFKNQSAYVPLTLCVLQVWLITKYLHK